MRVLVVGAGVSGLSCARALTEGGAEVTVLERSRVVGGRLASRRDPHGRYWDHGASYFTGLAPEGARLWTTRFRGEVSAGPERWVGRPHQRALAERWSEGLDVRLETEVTSATGSTLTLADGGVLMADAVVLAMPDPQAVRLGAPLEFEPWRARVVLGARLPSRTWDFDGWFVNDHPVITWIADDGSRRGDGAPVLVAHASAEWSGAHLLDADAAKAELVAALASLVPGEPDWASVQRWSFAAPSVGRTELFSLVDGLGICSDGWGPVSRVKTAWDSGAALAAALLAS